MVKGFYQSSGFYLGLTFLVGSLIISVILITRFTLISEPDSHWSSARKSGLRFYRHRSD